MRLGVHIVAFDFPGGPAATGPTLADVGRGRVMPFTPDPAGFVDGLGETSSRSSPTSVRSRRGADPGRSASAWSVRRPPSWPRRRLPPREAGYLHLHTAHLRQQADVGTGLRAR
jgi:hypothetical protein